MIPIAASSGDIEYTLRDLAVPLDLGTLVPTARAWEVELGFGKGRYLLHRAEGEPDRGFVGAEMAGSYYRLAKRRMCRRELTNTVLLHGEALYLLSVVLPRGFASAVHVYFPDPWPKARHQKRRLFDIETIDLVLDLLTDGGRLLFATDFLEYGEVVRGILDSYPTVKVTEVPGPWPDGARTNYEAKYMREGRPILRLEVDRTPASDVALHPRGEACVLAAVAPGPEEES
jgi:tRNA (guanine-N7-)-methyltransferase